MSGEDELKEATGQYSLANQRASEFDSLIDQLYREEVLDARKLSLEEKFLAGEELFEAACSVTLAGIRHDTPTASKEQCRMILRDRIALGERLDWKS